MNLRKLVIGLPVVALSTVLATTTGRADVDIYKGSDLSITGALVGAVAAFDVHNVDFGRGNNNLGGSEPHNNRNWYEGFAMPSLSFEYVLDDAPGYLTKSSAVYGQVSAIGSATRGNGDAVQTTSTTSATPSYLALENYYLGWRSGATLEGWGDDAVDFSVGNQPLTIGDGLLINGAVTNAFQRGAYYLSPRVAFKRTAVLKLNPSEVAPVRGTFFHLEAPSNQDLLHGLDQPAAKLVGGSVDWYGPRREEPLGAITDLWTVTGTYFNIYSAENPGRASTAGNRNGLNVYSGRVAGSFLPFDRNILFFSEYAYERNDQPNRKTRANGWYVEPGYQFSSLKWNPIVSYRYSTFSGDSDPQGDGTKHSFDSLWFGAGVRGLGPGTWYLGEIYGWYEQQLTNINVHQVAVRMSPLEDLNVGALYYRMNFNELGQVNQLTSTGGGVVTSKHAMDEFDVYAEWAFNDNISITPTFAVGIPGAGYRQVNTGTGRPGNSTILLGQVVFGFKF
jgi:hypothetical protein